jgi:hypothetical protein
MEQNREWLGMHSDSSGVCIFSLNSELDDGTLELRVSYFASLFGMIENSVGYESRLWELGWCTFCSPNHACARTQYGQTGVWLAYLQVLSLAVFEKSGLFREAVVGQTLWLPGFGNTDG